MMEANCGHYISIKQKCFKNLVLGEYPLTPTYLKTFWVILWQSSG